MPWSHRILTCDSREIEFSGDHPALNISDTVSRGIEFSVDDPALNISDTVFGFLDEESEGSTGTNYDNYVGVESEEDEEERENDKSFWDSHDQMLQATLCRTSSIETKVRNITKGAVKDAKESVNICICGRAVNGGCRNCLMKEVCRRLQNAGFDSAICKSKWRSSPEIPSGEHTFLDVIDNSSPKKGELRVIIELNFRAEFEMARASEEYKQLIKRLPEIFVGKIERLSSLIKILCTAAKKCMKEKKMHIGPWRKQRYMQAKWLRTCQRTTSSSQSLAGDYSSRPASRPKASMLTVDLMEINLPNVYRTAVPVV